MFSDKPPNKYVTHSDWAFVFVVFEHHIMKWRHLVQVELETGKPPSKEYAKTAPGLFYEGGMAGEAAKRRFDILSGFFYTNYYSKTSRAKGNMLALTNHLQQILKFHGEEFIRNNLVPQKTCSFHETQDDIVHRVFYAMYV